MRPTTTRRAAMRSSQKLRPCNSLTRIASPRVLDVRRGDRLAIVVAEMAANIVDYIRDLLVAHHASYRRHSTQSVQQHGLHVIGGGEIVVRGERGIGGGAHRALRVGLMAG